jgi:hypothetical protein
MERVLVTLFDPGDSVAEAKSFDATDAAGIGRFVGMFISAQAQDDLAGSIEFERDPD